ncbi:MAG: hypothetical protein HUJ85_02435 [Veillonella sp.]|nr:hypothetical protein [Veillonella sp.]
MGGLYAGSRVKALNEWPQLPQVVKDVEAVYPLSLTGFTKQIEAGDYVMNSDQPASVFVRLKEFLSGRQALELLMRMQEAFFLEGKDLRLAETYMPIVQVMGLEDQITEVQIEEALGNPQLAYEDYRKARALGVESYPTVTMLHNGTWYNLRGDALDEAGLENNFDNIANLVRKSFSCLGC